LNSDEFWKVRTLIFQAQLNDLFHIGRMFINRLALGVTALKLRDFTDKNSVFIFFDYYVELSVCYSNLKF